MLQVTDAAMDTLKGMRAESPAEGDAIARFYVEGEGGNQRIGLAFGQLSDADEKVADDGGLQVYVAPELVSPLSDAVVDAQPAGQGGAELFLRNQEPGES